MFSLPPHLLASFDRINAALEVAVEQPRRAQGTLFVCRATEDEWNAFADLDGQAVHAKFLDWFPDREEIHIIEFATTPHERYIGEFGRRTVLDRPHISRWLDGYGAAVNSEGRRASPDLSYGPREDTPGSVLPPGVPMFDDFRTIRIEIGVSQQWGMMQGQLDHKAVHVWAQMPGVEYVLCVHFDRDFGNAQYKLYDVRAMPTVPPLAPLPIVAPRTEVHMDSRRILGIQLGAALPERFPSTLMVDLYAPLRWAMR